MGTTTRETNTSSPNGKRNMIALDTRLQSLKTGQPQQDALVELFTALAAKAHEVSRIISAGGELGQHDWRPEC